MAAAFFAASALVFAWLRGPGKKPHDPPIATGAVRWFGVGLAILGGAWLVRSVAGLGGSLLVGGLVVLIALVFAARARVSAE